MFITNIYQNIRLYSNSFWICSNFLAYGGILLKIILFFCMLERKILLFIYFEILTRCEFSAFF